MYLCLSYPPRVISAQLSMRSVPVVVIVKGAIGDHRGDIWVAMLQVGTVFTYHTVVSPSFMFISLYFSLFLRMKTVN